MLVQLLHHPVVGSSPFEQELVRAWAEGLRAAGVRVQAPALDLPPNGAGLWVRGARPDVIHAFGVPATEAALEARPPVPVVTTFPESPVIGARAAQLATRVSAVVSLSVQEHHAWQRQGVRSLLPGPLPVPVAVPDRNACADPQGDVVAVATGEDLDELLRSMRYWTGRLTVLGRLAPERRARVERAIVERGLARRVRVRDLPARAVRARLWRQASLVYVGREHSQHGLPVLEAAAHGVPALARNIGANRDLVVSGTTGLLIEASGESTGMDPWTPGRALATMLSDPFQIRAMGTAALVRVGAAHAPATTTPRLTELYGRLVEGGAVAEPDPRRRPARDDLVLENLPLARQLAGWYTGRGQSHDDLVQVASVGLVHAARRYDPAHGREFHSFAIPTILGELRKHFRDHAWAVRVPRGLQETTLLVQRAGEALGQTLGRPPTVAEIAAHLGIVEEEVRLALQTEGEARYAHSLDKPLDSEPFESLIGAEDDALAAAELRHDVREAISQLPEREQQILRLRFYGERTQTEISELLGISQVHVSRVLSRTLAALRDYLLHDVPLPLAGAGIDQVRVAS